MDAFPGLSEEDWVPDTRGLENYESAFTRVGFGEENASGRSAIEEKDLGCFHRGGDLFGHRNQHWLEPRELRPALRTSPRKGVPRYAATPTRDSLHDDGRTSVNRHAYKLIGDAPSPEIGEDTIRRRAGA